MTREHTDFHKLNDKSYDHNHELLKCYMEFFWDEFYDVEVVYDKKRQFMWIDKVIFLQNGCEVSIDDKIRFKYYWDILLEEWSNYEDRRVWWACRDDLATDYIFYYFADKKKCFVFSHRDIYQCIKDNYQELKKYRNNSTTKSDKVEKWYYTTTFFTVTKEYLVKKWVDVFEINL